MPTPQSALCRTTGMGREGRVEITTPQVISRARGRTGVHRGGSLRRNDVNPPTHLFLHGRVGPPLLPRLSSRAVIRCVRRSVRNFSFPGHGRAAAATLVRYEAGCLRSLVMLTA